MKKLFVIRKYIWAKNAQDAINRESKQRPDDVWWDDDHKKGTTNPKDSIGFQTDKES